MIPIHIQPHTHTELVNTETAGSINATNIESNDSPKSSQNTPKKRQPPPPPPKKTNTAAETQQQQNTIANEVSGVSLQL